MSLPALFFRTLEPMPSIYTELTAVMVLVIVTTYGSVMSGAPRSVVLDISTAVTLLGMATAIGNAAARELACMTVRWGMQIMIHVLLI